MKKLFICGLLGLGTFASQHTKAQLVPNQYDYRFNNQILNPAQAGADEKASLKALSRFSLGNAQRLPVNQAVIASLKLPKNFGLGLMLDDYRLGPVVSQRMILDLSYRIQLSRNINLNAGIRGTYLNYSASLIDLRREAFNDPKFLSGNVREDIGDGGLGLLLYGKKFFVGASIAQIRTYTNEMPVEFRAMKRLYNLYGGYNLKVSSNFELRPSVLFSHYSEYYSLLDFNLQAVFNKKVHTGIFYRLDRSIGLSAALDVNDNWYVGYLATIPVGMASYHSLPLSNQISLRYQWRQTKYEKAIVSPRFFE